MDSHKFVNIFHLLVVFPVILLVIYKDKFGPEIQSFSKNLLRVLVLLGIINHTYKVIS